MQNYYQVLGVAPTATAEEIKSRYRFLAKAYHPDRFTDADSKAQAENEMKRLNEAYAVLSNPEKRREYDARMGAGIGSASETDHESEENYRHATEMIAYLQQLEQRWAYLLTPFPDITAVDEVRGYLLQMFSALIRLVYPENSEMLNKAHIETIDKRVLGMAITNIFLGAEGEKNGFPKQFNPVDLQIISSLPVQEMLHELFQVGRMRGRLTENEAQEKGDTIARTAFLLCEASQKVGRETYRQRTSARQQANPNPRPSTESASPRPKPHPSPPKKASPASSPAGYCQSCFQRVPTEQVTFHQNIGLLVMRHHKSIEGAMCADCVENHFWEMTGITFFFGWWGLISFITTPFILILNVFNYLSAWGLRKYSNRLHTIATGWKTFTFIGITAIILFAIYLPQAGSNTNAAPPANRNPASVYSSAPTVKPRPTRTPPPTVKPKVPIGNLMRPTATEPSCTLWSKVRAADEGKRMCVYGTVKKAYWGDRTFYMSFSDDPNSFRFIVLNGYYFEDVQGGCAMAEGVIKVYGKMPYIEVGEELLMCE